MAVTIIQEDSGIDTMEICKGRTYSKTDYYNLPEYARAAKAANTLTSAFFMNHFLHCFTAPSVIPASLKVSTLTKYSCPFTNALICFLVLNII